MRDLIFLGGLFPANLINEIEENSIGVIQYAANTLQWNILKGMEFYIGSIKLINLLYIGSFPKRYKNFQIKTSNFSYGENIKGINVGFINITGYKILSRYYNAKKALKKVTKSDDIIMIYGINLSLLMAAVRNKKRKADIKICLIVSDLPEYASQNDILFKKLKRIEENIIEKILKEIDAFVLLSDCMVEPLKIHNRPWVRIEGIFDPTDILKDLPKEKYKTILYTGTLAKRYGILNLLDAFSLIKDQEYRLWICGDGDARDEINERSKNDLRIINFSQMPRNKVLELQKKATVLVNPRTSAGAFTKYSFPSKTMEYLASGTPCIIHKLEGIPKEYFKYCFVSSDETPIGLSKMIFFVCEKSESELREFGEKAKQFILNEKTPVKQCEKIYKMLRSL